MIEDCISRKAVLNTLEFCDKALDVDRTVESYKSLLVECYKMLPSIQPKTGHWKKLNVGYGCSECSLATNKSGVDFYRFCPNCGAKMESEVST